MNLESVLFDKSSLTDFKEKYFVYEDLTKYEKFISNHHLELLNHNWTLKNKDIDIRLYDLKVDDVYIYENIHGQYCLYIILELSHSQFDVFFKKFGDSMNVSYSEYLNDDFAFINWMIGEWDIYLNTLHMLDKSRKMYIFQIMNMPYGEIMDFRPI
ncbi:hypothetical protein [Sphingobacterium tabacisoli]|uniref:Uncharacterized protein n=1 Tax=Sphingobacterium tabacisoli TaxID=2044855 RepID=A0ABW5L1M1_9SPHI|nr:hypothetical protein [Sphingobacterium tabacisoli]